MYLEAQQLSKVIHQVLDLCREQDGKRKIIDLFYKASNGNIDQAPAPLLESLNQTKQKLVNLLTTLSTQELIILRCVHDIGRSERGYRTYIDSSKTEIIIMDIQASPQELLYNYSKYLIYETKDRLIKYFTQRMSIPEYLLEGIKILNL